MRRRRSYIWSLVYFGGMLLAFIGERIVGAGSARALTGVGVLMIGVALGGARGAIQARAGRSRARRAHAHSALRRRRVRGRALLRAVGSVGDGAAASRSSATRRKLATVLAALWPALWLTAALPILIVRVQLRVGGARAASSSSRASATRCWSGLGLAGALVFAFAHLLRRRRARQEGRPLVLPHRQARRVDAQDRRARSISRSQVALFFPPANEVREEVPGYFDDLDEGVEAARGAELRPRGRSGEGARSSASRATASSSSRAAARREQMSLGHRARGGARAAAQPRQGRAEAAPAGGAAGAHRVLRPRATASATRARRRHRQARDHPRPARAARAAGLHGARARRRRGAGLRRAGRRGDGDDRRADEAVPAGGGGGAAALLRARRAPASSRSIPRAGDMQRARSAPLGVVRSRRCCCNDVGLSRASSTRSATGTNIVTATYSSHPSVTTLGRYGGRAPLILHRRGPLRGAEGQAEGR